MEKKDNTNSYEIYISKLHSVFKTTVIKLYKKVKNKIENMRRDLEVIRTKYNN